MEEWSSPSSPSLVVRSPRQTLSLLRNRHPGRESRLAPTSTSTSLAGGPKPSEVYGFVGSITTVIATTVYLVWAYMPERCLRSLGITYYPSRYWALAVPSFVIVATTLCMVVYVGFNFLATPPPTSFNTIFDEYSRERTMFDPANANATGEEKEVERPIEPISDISIDQTAIPHIKKRHDFCGGREEEETMEKSPLVASPETAAAMEVAARFRSLVDNEDVGAIKQMQHLILGRLQDSNAVLTHFNECSEQCFAEVSNDFAGKTRLVKSMKADLDHIFLKLRSMKSRLAATYPDAFPDGAMAKTMDQRPDLESPLD